MSRRIARNHHRSRPHAPDASDTHAPDASDTHAPPISVSDSSSDSDGESTRLSGLAASFRIVSESLLRMEQSELEMTKAREVLRLKAEKRRLESEAELTQMLLQTQLQIASLVSRGPDRDRASCKRKRSDEEGVKEENDSSSDVSKRISLALAMLQSTMLL